MFPGLGVDPGDDVEDSAAFSGTGGGRMSIALCPAATLPVLSGDDGSVAAGDLGEVFMLDCFVMRDELDPNCVSDCNSDVREAGADEDLVFVVLLPFSPLDCFLVAPS